MAIEDVHATLKQLFISPIWVREMQELQARRAAYDGEVFPAALIKEIDRALLHLRYIPAENGGALSGFDEAYMLVRGLAAQDLTLAVAHCKTFLGAVSVWIAGNNDQALLLAARITQGTAVSLALTERRHGSDIMASDTTAALDDDGAYLLSGEKWLINNATRAGIVLVYARTGYRRNARNFSLFLVDKEQIASASIEATGKNLTHGVVEADISGIRFDAVPLGAASMIGAEGSGLETVLKGFQITRTLCAGLSCGGAERALALALRFARERRVGESTLDRLPLVANVLETAAVEMLMIDVLAHVGARAINVVPEAMSVISPIVKSLVPERACSLVEALVEVMGARSFVEDDAVFGGFARIQRDLRLVPIFDGNTAVNLHALQLQLRGLALARRRRPEGDRDLLTALYDIGRPVSSVSLRQLTLASHQPCVGLAELDETARDLVDRVGRGEVDLASLATRAAELITERDAIEAEALAMRLDPRHPDSPAIDLAERYGRLFAAASCLHFFVFSRAHLHAVLRDGAWADAAILRLLGRPARSVTGLRAMFLALADAGRMLGAVDMDAAGGDQYSRAAA